MVLLRLRWRFDSASGDNNQNEEIMNRFKKQCIVAGFGLAAFIGLIGTVGSYEYADEVVYSMPEEVYYTILDTLGDDCSNKAVAEEYMSKREYYDNLQY